MCHSWYNIPRDVCGLTRVPIYTDLVIITVAALYSCTFVGCQYIMLWIITTVMSKILKPILSLKYRDTVDTRYVLKCHYT